MAIHEYMKQDLEDMVEDLEIIAGDLDANRSPCCKKDRFRLWDNESEARLHRRIIAIQKKIKDIANDISTALPIRR